MHNTQQTLLELTKKLYQTQDVVLHEVQHKNNPIRTGMEFLQAK